MKDYSFMLLVYNITNENVILKILTWFDVDRYVGRLYAVLLITGIRLQRLLTTSLRNQPNVSGACRKGTKYP